MSAICLSLPVQPSCLLMKSIRDFGGHRLAVYCRLYLSQRLLLRLGRCTAKTALQLLRC